MLIKKAVATRQSILQTAFELIYVKGYQYTSIATPYPFSPLVNRPFLRNL